MSKMEMIDDFLIDNLRLLNSMAISPVLPRRHEGAKGREEGLFKKFKVFNLVQEVQFEL